MPVKFKNKNRFLFYLKPFLRNLIYSHILILTSFLKSKSAVIRLIKKPKLKNNLLFKKIFIETISYCNNNCSFCPASVDRGAKHKDDIMSRELFLKIIDELHSLDFKGSVAFHCNNEPLLDPRLVELVRIARSLLKVNYFYLYTNGFSISLELTRDLFQAGLNRIIIDNYNDSYRLLPSVKRIVNNAHTINGDIIVSYRRKTEFFGNRAGQCPNARSVLRRPLNIMCLRPLEEIIVGYDGTVPLCTSDGLWRKKMGNAQIQNLKDIWFSSGFMRTREFLYRADRSYCEICQKCDAVKFPNVHGI